MNTRLKPKTYWKNLGVFHNTVGFSTFAVLVGLAGNFFVHFEKLRSGLFPEKSARGSKRGAKKAIFGPTFWPIFDPFLTSP